MVDLFNWVACFVRKYMFSISKVACKLISASKNIWVGSGLAYKLRLGWSHLPRINTLGYWTHF